MKNTYNPLKGDPTFGLKNRFLRVFWMIVWTLFARWTPRHFWKFRRLILILFGAEIGQRSDVRGTAKIWWPGNLQLGNNCLIAEGVDVYNIEKISLGNNVIISQRCWLCTASHDYTDINFPMIAKVIDIKSDVWVAAEAFIGPGVTVGQGAVIAARSSLVKSANCFSVYGGNPAFLIKEYKKVEI